jgi:hypothetical protein
MSFIFHLRSNGGYAICSVMEDMGISFVANIFSMVYVAGVHCIGGRGQQE